MLAKPYKYEFSQMRDRIREHTTHLHRLVIEKEAIRTAQAREGKRLPLLPAFALLIIM